MMPGGRGLTPASGEPAPRVVVFGATGFIGSAVVRLLAGRPVRLRLVARRHIPLPSDPVADIETRAVDVTDDGALSGLVEDATAVVHLMRHHDGERSWRFSDDDPAGDRVTVGTVRDLLDTLAADPPSTPPLCLLAGSVSQVGVHTRPRLDGSEVDAPASAYDRQKLTAERILFEGTRRGLVRGVSLRFPTIFGAPAHGSVIDHGIVSAMIRRGLAGHPLTLWNNGSVERDLLYVDDAASAVVAALDRPDALVGRHWLLGSEECTSLDRIFTRLSEAVAWRTGTSPVPVVGVEPPAHATPPDFQSYRVDATAFRRRTGWRPTVPLDQGLERTVSHLIHARAIAEP
ncbi:NAD(P)-dependent oxidoreductase [Spiractinospora alimapuensis]|uniref:NAD-dependent epimerase/dehydratase family protein n=1 Tax=Spiractinospora alimapuensis TaxID=2820884 RepID=UPI001F2F1C09|nr:NAD(P)-dependent oxidoreductase [Spiractinospora alimapuensis]QVQ51818.1 NAD(P)-dependent oxidoreductase [Spiractinospora alimapuensis]